MNEEKLELKEAETEKEFYVLVSYYSSVVPFAYLAEKPDGLTFDKAYKISVPYRKLEDKQN